MSSSDICEVLDGTTQDPIIDWTQRCDIYAYIAGDPTQTRTGVFAQDKIVDYDNYCARKCVVGPNDNSWVTCHDASCEAILPICSVPLLGALDQQQDTTATFQLKGVNAPVEWGTPSETQKILWKPMCTVLLSNGGDFECTTCSACIVDTRDHSRLWCPYKTCDQIKSECGLDKRYSASALVYNDVATREQTGGVTLFFTIVVLLILIACYFANRKAMRTIDEINRQALQATPVTQAPQATPVTQATPASQAARNV
jgi:hypothetical protein